MIQSFLKGYNQLAFSKTNLSHFKGYRQSHFQISVIFKGYNKKAFSYSNFRHFYRL